MLNPNDVQGFQLSHPEITAKDVLEQVADALLEKFVEVEGGTHFPDQRAEAITDFATEIFLRTFHMDTFDAQDFVQELWATSRYQREVPAIEAWLAEKWTYRLEFSEVPAGTFSHRVTFVEVQDFDEAISMAFDMRKTSEECGASSIRVVSVRKATVSDTDEAYDIQRQEGF